ncbi:hypothetical protein [Desulforhabdus amnigena]|jgi:hypothetical protein|uniref:Tetratricopeptide repeat protein n=1 Tax=Desulforhabdus amnigena TaxID=40218 RepID=A0A9W6FSQ6_9BACT|nr:hypothetical protein [Desulforhabdus amnigena]NLJ28171.1 hypothetical protein [Deltaproteobacteria bacterium]GLI34294.1 hypothetical protein DAMNIGENAA_17270 [Desulforhabdus amnigena]
MKDSFLFKILSLILLLFFFGGCAAHTPPPPRVELQPVYVFPPQKAMASNDYAAFLEENRKILEDCSKDCDIALFNVAFVYAFPQSPFYNQSEGLKRLKEVMEKYPESPFAFQARVMTALIENKIVAEKKRSQLKGKLKSKDTKIQKLQKQIERSRAIDLEMDRKERELLQ